MRALRTGTRKVFSEFYVIFVHGQFPGCTSSSQAVMFYISVTRNDNMGLVGRLRGVASY
jgi:hypothetical protein